MKLRPHKSGSVGREDSGYEFWCQGCARTHYVPTWASTHSNMGRPTYEFNGDVEHPTFRPAVRTMAGSAGEWIDDGMGNRLWIPTYRPIPYCIVTVTAGQLRYSRDCGHYLAGAAATLFDIPTTREQRIDLTALSEQMNERHKRNPIRAMCVVGVGIVVGDHPIKAK